MKSFSASNIEILRFIIESIRHRGFPPTQVEICKQMDYSGVRAAQYHLDQIEDNGWITRTPAISRGIKVTPLGFEVVR